MKKSIVALVSKVPKDLVVDCGVSAILVVGFTLVGFISRSMVMDLQANLLMMA